MTTETEHLYKRGDRIHDSVRNKSYVWLYYIELRTQLNQFEMFENNVTEPSDQVVLGFEYLKYQDNDAIKMTGQKTPLPVK